MKANTKSTDDAKRHGKSGQKAIALVVSLGLFLGIVTVGGVLGLVVPAVLYAALIFIVALSIVVILRAIVRAELGRKKTGSEIPIVAMLVLSVAFS